MDNNKFFAKCNNCGVSSIFCGYHNVGKDEISLCPSCAGEDIVVWCVSLMGETSGGILHDNLITAIETMNDIMNEMSNDDEVDGYSIYKKKINRLDFECIGEFQGF